MQNTSLKKKISIVIPAYNAEKSIKATVESLLRQTYQNLEIIIVNDGSTDTTEAVGKAYGEQHPHVKVLTLKQNSGLFKARLEGADIATGDYLAFLDADDHVSLDYYRCLINKAEETDADMVLSEIVMDDRNIDRTFVNNIANDLPFQTLQGQDGFHEYMDQRGHNFVWHVAWNKLIRKDLWDAARPHYDLITKHLIMTEDMAISTPLWYFAQKVARAQTSYHFYVKDDEGGASTALGGLSFKKAFKSLDDMKTAFSFLDEFFAKQKVSEFYQEALLDWKKQYVRIWHGNIGGSNLIKGRELAELTDILDSIAPFDKDEQGLDSKFYEVTTDWNDKLETLKQKIVSHDTISFDIFDTLVVRPFLTPSDMFILLNETFAKLHPEITVLRFSDMRFEAEMIAREAAQDPDTVDIHGIYDALHTRFSIPTETVAKMKRLETDMEVFYCTPRKTGLELFTLANELGKSIILTTDMYLPRETIEAILSKNGITGWNTLFISSEAHASKSAGTLYELIRKELKLNSQNALHIGDSYHSDFEKAQKHGFASVQLPKATDVFEQNPHLSAVYNQRKGSLAAHIGKEYLGVSSSIALSALRMFDNPFAPFNPDSVFNGSPSTMGYFALGMHMLGVSLWLHDAGDQNGYQNFVFLGRDGYLPQKAFSVVVDRLEKKKKNPVGSHYMPTSRKATTPLSVRSLIDTAHLQTFITPNNKTFAQALEVMRPVIDYDKAVASLKQSKLTLEDELTEKNYASFVESIQASHDTVRSEALQDAFRNSFGDMLTNAAVFDIGYSAKPEQIFAKVTNKKIDTFFIHSYGEGKSRSQDYTGVSLNTFYDFSPVVTGGLRELLISELGPSAIQYSVVKGEIAVKYDDTFKTDYYERYVIEAMQRSAIEFVDDFLAFFGPYLPSLTYTNRYISLPYEQLLNHPTAIDKQVFIPIPFEDDIGIGKVGSILDVPTLQSHGGSVTLHDVLYGASKLKKGVVYMALDPLHLVHKTRDAVSTRLKSYPTVHRQLKKTYRSVKRIVRKIK